jgi:putative glycosyltransferase (TIGR04372 family)
MTVSTFDFPKRKRKSRSVKLLQRIVYGLPSIVVWLAGIRFLRVSVPDRIGHLALEPDCYLKERALTGRREIAVLALSEREVANQALLEYWKRHLIVIQNPVAVFLLRPFLRLRYIRRDLSPFAVAINATARAYAIQARWGARPPLLKLSEQHQLDGENILQRLGLPPGAWFVCVHSREGGYSPRDEDRHSYRNGDIADYVLAMKEIVARGGWCIRMGDPTMKRLPPMPGVIDYAHSEAKSDWMDLFLCANCRFLLGSSSGLYLVAMVFGRPAALANQAPLSCVYSQGYDDLAIPKLVLREDGSPVPFKEAFALPLANFRYTVQFERERLQCRNNTPEEIRDLALEMLDRLEGVAIYTEEDERLQTKFRSFFREGHYSFGASSRIGRDFLRSHATLI